MRKISVIIPVYNTSGNLKQCLDSVRNQTYTNLEIICVDDGSTDGSGEILDEYGLKDNRFVIVHEENLEESHARNVGLKLATGDYIAFIDSDDWIESDMYEVLVDVIEKNDVDMSICGWFKDDETKSIPIRNKLSVNQRIISNTELLTYIFMRDSYKAFAYIWDKLYKRELLRRPDGSEIVFDEIISLGEDVLFLTEVALNTDRAMFYDRAMYHYRQRKISACHTTDLNKLVCLINVYEMVIKLCQEKNVTDETLRYIKRFLAYHSSNFAEEALNQGNDEKKILFQNYMKQYKDDYCRLNVEYPDRIERYISLLQQ